MSNERNGHEIEPEPLFSASLRWLEGEVPTDEVDWESLRSAIHDRAELPLARRRRKAKVVRWARPLVPAVVAAGLAGIIVMGGVGRPEPSMLATQTAIEPASMTAEQVLRADMSEQDFRLLVSGRSDPDALLQMAVNE